MPTGYTADIKDDTTFEQFAMKCARNFGACITMRDDDLDAEIEIFEPSKYHADKIKEIKDELYRILNMSVEDMESEITEEVEKRWRELNDQIRKADIKRSNYERLILEAKNWNPPTPDHRELRSFMIEQLETSIKHDCTTDYYKDRFAETHISSADKWSKAKIEELEKDILYHQEHQAEEEERVKGRNKWIQALRRSL